MATRKLSEVLAETGLSLDDLIDDETNLPIPEVRKRFKENVAQYQKGQEKLTQKDQELKQYADAYQGWRTRAEQLEAQSQNLERQIAERAEKVAAAGGDWKRDPLFADLVGEFDGISRGIVESREASSALARGMLGIAQKYTEDRKAFMNWVDKAEQRFMKMDHPDFDAEEIRKWAHENGVTDSWEGSYTRHKASKLPETEAKIRAEEREKVLAEHGDKFKAPVETEMGGSSRPVGPVGGPQKKDYKDAWSNGGLVKEFENLGRGI